MLCHQRTELLGIIAALMAMRLPREPADRLPPARPRKLSRRPDYSLPFPPCATCCRRCVALGLLATPYVPLMPSIVSRLFRRRVLHPWPADELRGLGASPPRLPVAAAGLRPAAPADVHSAIGGRRGAHVVCLVARLPVSGLLLAVLGGGHSSARMPRTPCCNSLCPTIGEGASLASTACRSRAPHPSAG